MLHRRNLLLSSAFMPIFANAQMGNSTVGEKTPYDYGAKGGAIVSACTINRGGNSIAGITSADAGKIVMIAGAASDGRSLITRVQPDGSLNLAVARDVINASYHMGFDDGPALQRFLSAGGGIIPNDIFLCQKPPLKYGDNCRVHWKGTILIGEGWPSGFSLMGESYGWTGRERRLKNIEFRGEGEKPHIFLSPANVDITPGRKGIGITCTDGFELTGIKISGGIGSLFALQIHYSTSGTVRDCQLTVDCQQVHQGSDGIHFLGNCNDIRVIGLRAWTGDDSTSQTSEIPLTRATSIQRISYEDCVLENIGHSSVKAFINRSAEASVIQDIEYKNCRFVTYLAEKGHGAPLILVNEAKSLGGIIRRITISGGETIVDDARTKQIAGPAISLKGVDDFLLSDHTLMHCGGTAIFAEECNNLRISNVKITPRRLLASSSFRDRPPLVKLVNCAEAKVETKLMKSSYEGQALISP